MIHSLAHNGTITLSPSSPPTAAYPLDLLHFLLNPIRVLFPFVTSGNAAPSICKSCISTPFGVGGSGRGDECGLDFGDLRGGGLGGTGRIYNFASST